MILEWEKALTFIGGEETIYKIDHSIKKLCENGMSNKLK